jgi:hypothetical protein
MLCAKLLIKIKRKKKEIVGKTISFFIYEKMDLG